MRLRPPSILSVAVALGAFASPVACSEDRGGFDEQPLDSGVADSPRTSEKDDAGATVDDAGAVVDAAVPDIRVECHVTPCVVALAARGGAHVCALLSDETVACWGADDTGQLGRGTPEGGADPDEHGAHPAKVAGVSGATQISAVGAGTAGTSCARLKDGSVMCWGANTHGQLLPGTLTTDEDPHPTPVRIEGLTSAARIDVTGAFACAVERGSTEHAGELECWGFNSALQLGRGYLPKSHGGIAKVSLGFRSVVAASGNLRNGFAIATDGELLSWGGSTWELGGSTPVRDAIGRETSISPDGTPTPIPGLANVTSVSASEEHACAVADGRVYCWGRNPTGAIGNGSRQDVPIPYAVNTGAAQRLRDVAVSNRTTCARAVDGAIYCWGDNSDGQLGDGKAASTLYPVWVEKIGGRVVQVAAMDRATCALLEEGSVKCWGSNDSGQLGLGTRDDDPHYAPQKVVF